MATLGSTSEPTTFAEGYGLNSVNQMAQALTLPSGGPWRIYRLGGHLAGWNSTARYRLVLWSSAARCWARHRRGLSPAAATSRSVPASTPRATSAMPLWPAGLRCTPAGGTIPRPDRERPDRIRQPRPRHRRLALRPVRVQQRRRWHRLVPVLHRRQPGPDAPTIREPDQNEAVNTQSPTIDWDFNYPDGDSQGEYKMQIDTSSGSSSPIADTNWQTSSSTSTPSAPPSRVVARTTAESSPAIRRASSHRGRRRASSMSRTSRPSPSTSPSRTVGLRRCTTPPAVTPRPSLRSTGT